MEEVVVTKIELTEVWLHVTILDGTAGINVIDDLMPLLKFIVELFTEEESRKDWLLLLLHI